MPLARRTFATAAASTAVVEVDGADDLAAAAGSVTKGVVYAVRSAQP